MPNREIPDAWKLDSGLRETMDLTVHAAYFSTSADYQGGRVYQIFLIGSDETDEPVDLRMSVGADWTSNDGGATISHPTKKRINKNSVYGHFINAAIECPEVINGQTLADVLFSHESPLAAAIWINVRVHLDLTEIIYGGDIKNVERLLPTHYLGLAADTPAQPPTQPPLQPTITPDKVSTPTPQQLVEQAKSAAAVTQNGTGSALYQEMLTLAGTVPTQAEFMSAAFARADVLADEELAIQIADESIFRLAHMGGTT